jgi:hypothetical protein
MNISRSPRRQLAGISSRNTWLEPSRMHAVYCYTHGHGRKKPGTAESRCRARVLRVLTGERKHTPAAIIHPSRDGLYAPPHIRCYFFAYPVVVLPPGVTG